MHKVKVDEEAALVEVTLWGQIAPEESPGLCAEVRRAIGSLRGRPIKILVDAQFLRPVAPDIADEFRAVQEYGVSVGVHRVAQVIDSSVVMLQRTRIQREAGTDPMTQTFRELAAARRWLLSDEPVRPPPASTRAGRGG